DINAAALPPEPGDHLVHTIAVQVGGLNGMAVNQSGVDDLAVPKIGAPAVYHHLGTVPGFNRSQETGSAEPAYGDIARAGFGPGSGVAFGDFAARPAAVFTVLKEVKAGEAGGEDGIAAGAVPICDENAMDHARVFRADHAALPFAGAIVDQRRLIAIVGRGGQRAGERGVDHNGM